MSGFSLGIRLPQECFEHGVEILGRRYAASEAAGLSPISCGDHVTFKGGQGFDGLVQATAMAALSERAKVMTAVYLLPLRHPVPVARQLASLAALCPGRLIFGVGIGGEDRHEVEACGVEPSTRGRRADEALEIIRPLLRGEIVTFDGPLTPVRGVHVSPSPDPAVPILVGGRSNAALRRAATYGDGWLGIWVSARRFSEAIATVEEFGAARPADTSWHHGLQLWCGFGPTKERSRAWLAAAMEALYQRPFEDFERWCPYGSPDEVADMVASYAVAGATEVSLLPTGANWLAAIKGAAEVRQA